MLVDETAQINQKDGKAQQFIFLFPRGLFRSARFLRIGLLCLTGIPL